jgi:hypothetical protein
MNTKAAMWATIIVVAVLAFIVILATSPTSILIVVGIIMVTLLMSRFWEMLYRYFDNKIK